MVDGRLLGKHSGLTLFIASNSNMLKELNLEKNRLGDVVIFLATFNPLKLPTHNFINNWFQNNWVKKLGYSFSFYLNVMARIWVKLVHSLLRIQVFKCISKKNLIECSAKCMHYNQTM